MSKIYFCGDPHSRFDHIVKAVQMHRPDAVILLGDLTPDSPLHLELKAILEMTELYWIPGNHDTDEAKYYDHLYGSELAERNLHGRVEVIAGVKIAGLGGVFRASVWDGQSDSNESPQSFMKSFGKSNKWRGGISLRHRSTIFPSVVQDLSKQRADILVTHEAPDLHKMGNVALTRLVDAMRVRAAFHGHHHEDVIYEGTIWRGVAVRGIVALDTETMKLTVI